MSDSTGPLLTPAVHDRQVREAEVALIAAIQAKAKRDIARVRARADLARQTMWAAWFPGDAQAQRHMRTAAQRWRRLMATPLPATEPAAAVFEAIVANAHATVIEGAVESGGGAS